LNPSQNRHARAMDEDRSAGDAIVGEGRFGAIPGFQVERTVGVSTVLVQGTEESREFIPDDADGRVFTEQLSEFLNGRVARGVATEDRLGGDIDPGRFAGHRSKYILGLLFLSRVF